MATQDPTANFSFHVIKNFQEKPDKTILFVENESVTCQELHERVTSMVHLLKWKHVGSNDRVLMTVQPSVDFYAIAIAVMAVGGSLVIIDPAMGLERCNHCIATAKPAAWLWKKGSKYRFLKYFLPSLRSIPVHLEISDLSLPTSSKELLDPFEVESVEHALVTFTTGSTGMPKLLLRKHSFLLNQSHSLSMSYDLVVKKELDFEECDAIVATNLPVFLLHYLKVGSMSLLYPNIVKCVPAEVVKTLKQFNVHGIFGSPAFIEKLATYALKNNTTLPVKFTGVGGAPVFRGAFRTIAAATPNKKAFVVYGSTEVEPVSEVFATEKMELESCQPDGHCVGKPVFKGSVKIIKILDEPITEPVNIAEELELPCGQAGEVIVSGWHVNTYQVDSRRLLTDLDGTVWLRIEDAGYMDSDGNIWLVGRVKWRVERNGRTYWSTVVEQKVLDRCSLVTFAAYLPHNGEAWLFLEAPKGLPDKEKAGIQSFLSREDIPVDHLEIRKELPRDRRHRSKPDTAALFSQSNPNSAAKVIKFFLKSNPLLALLLVFVQLMLIFCALVVIVWH